MKRGFLGVNYRLTPPPLDMNKEMPPVKLNILSADSLGLTL
jgi:hypothetical protein